MAFYRTKRVHGKEYRQLVENYRDESGKHKQRVLAHLGRYETVEEAAEYFEGFAATSCKSAEEHRAKAQEHAEQHATRARQIKRSLPNSTLRLLLCAFAPLREVILSHG